MSIAGTVVIKNMSGAPYPVEELMGYVLAPSAEVDLMNSALPFFYSDWIAANRLVTALPTAKLFRDIQVGKIQVVLNKRLPSPRS